MLVLVAIPSSGALAEARPAGVTGPGAVPAAHLTIVNQPAWFADADPRKGSVTQPVAVFTPEPCPAGTTRHKTSVVAVRAARPADQAAADRWPAWGNLYSPVAAELPGPLVAYPAAMSWSTMAGLHGLQVVPGTYELVTRCQDALGQRILREWRGAVVFDSATSYHVPAPYATALGRTAMASRSVPMTPAPSSSVPGATPSTPAEVLPEPLAPSTAPTPSSAASDPASDAPPVVAAPARDEGAARSGTGWATVALAVMLGAALLAAGVVVAARRGRDG